MHFPDDAFFESYIRQNLANNVAMKNPDDLVNNNHNIKKRATTNNKSSERHRFPVDTIKSTATMMMKDASYDGLKDFLLVQLRQWGNNRASIYAIKPAHQKPGTTLYVGFSNAKQLPNHAHRSNNMFALVDLGALQVTWCCQDPECRGRPRVQTELPIQWAL